MDIDSVQARIEHESAELRARYPHITGCHSALIQWSDAGRKRYSLALDLRWPEHQTLVSGEAMDDAGAAVAAAFARARQRVL
ncbi:MAG TPA: hypothetical protein VKE95_07360 [Burkholderiales bacterium]|nr:hypothetical protein [Burkholderiales bacterium]